MKPRSARASSIPPSRRSGGPSRRQRRIGRDDREVIVEDRAARGDACRHRRSVRTGPAEGFFEEALELGKVPEVVLLDSVAVGAKVLRAVDHHDLDLRTPLPVPRVRRVGGTPSVALAGWAPLSVRPDTLPRMPHPTLQCPTPNCRSAPDDLRLVFNTESHHRIDSQSGSELYVRDGHFESPDPSLNPRMRCRRCGVDSPLPKGITVFLVRDGTKTRMFTVT